MIGEVLNKNFKNMELKQILKIRRKCALTGKSITSKLNYSKKYSAEEMKKNLDPNPTNFLPQQKLGNIFQDENKETNEGIIEEFFKSSL